MVVGNNFDRIADIEVVITLMFIHTHIRTLHIDEQCLGCVLALRVVVIENVLRLVYYLFVLSCILYNM